MEEKKLKRVEIIVEGLVQGVGFRYYVLRNANALGIKGYTKNLYSGEVFSVAEGDKEQLEEFVRLVKQGPSHSMVRDFSLKWGDALNEFSHFEIRH